MSLDLNLWKAIDPGQFFEAVAEDENTEFVVGVMRRLTVDPVWTESVIQLVESKRIETRCFVSWLAREMQPQTYLEVGVRRGFSMAMVAARAPGTEMWGFDLWMPKYAGAANPGPRFVQAELEKVGYRRKAHFIRGNSHTTLPAFFRMKGSSLRDRVRLRWQSGNRPQIFDMILVDGDHSLLGAYQDLVHTMPHCAVGGVVVFDDIALENTAVDPEVLRRERGEDPWGWGDLLGVWRAIQERFHNFRYFEYVRNPPGVGVGVRLW
ncbi:MAG: hypothetical protein DRI40_06310 [Chloroflexi bacterium]|nr:MAG: hypothetical protein DRI40_06310 [Chloroflexota bacterium]